MIYLASWTNPARIRDWLVGLVARLPARVQTKLLAAFLTIAGLLIVLGAVGLQVLSGVNGRTEELITLQRKIAAYHQVQHDTTTQLYSISTALLLRDDRMLDAALRQLNQFGYDLDRMEFVAKDEAELLGEVRKEYDRFTVTVTRVVDVIRAGRTAEARDMQLAEIVPLADRLERMTNQLVNIAEADMVAAIDATGRTYRTARIIVIAFALGSLLLALGLGYVISWSLVAPVREIEARLRRIAAGEFNQRVDVVNRDEFGVLASNVNQTSEQLGRLYSEIEARTEELSEALEQQTATGAILRVIAASPTDIQPVFDTVAESAARLCEAYDSLILLKEGEAVSLKAHHGPMTISTRKWEMTRDWVSGRAMVDRVPVHVHDLFDAADEFPASHEMALQEGQRSIVAVPLLRKGEAIGVIAIRRLEVQPFTKKQIDLLTTFADQAVIAIENVRLFEEVQTRNRELTESLEQQTATSTILRAIAASPTDVQPVLNAVAESAARLCEAYDCVIFLKYGESLDVKAHYGSIPLDFNKWPIGRGYVSGRAFLDRKPVHLHDATEDTGEFPEGRAMAARLGYRTILAVPLLREGEAIGILSIARIEARPFSPKRVELLTTFADQAVIAIQNVRLFDEVQQRNRELSEALEQQTATSTILRAIAASPTDVQPVLDAVAESAAKLCDAYDAAILLKDGESLAWKSHHGPIPIDFANWPIGRDWVTGRAFVDRKPVHVDDLTAAADEFPAGQAMAKRLGHRTILAMPLLREEEAIGALVIRRLEVRPFTQKQIELLTIFADQAVIAIENVRLFNEVEARTRDLSEALQQQTATADVLKAISRSTFDLPAVLNTLVDSAAKLCNANYGGIFLRDGEHLRGCVTISERPQIGWDLNHPMDIDRTSISGRVMLSSRVEIIPDVDADPEYNVAPVRPFSDFRSLMGVPLFREGKVDGVFFLGRPEPGSFTQRQSDLVQTFADQAVIAIENVRLFDEVQARTMELSEALQQQTATAEVLKVISRSVFDLDSVLNTLVKSAIDLCRATGGNIHLRDGSVYRIRAQVGWPAEFAEYIRRNPIEPGRGTVAGRAILTRSVAHIPDVLEDTDYAITVGHKMAGYRALLGVPLIRDDEVIGAISLGRAVPEPFLPRELELVQTFADQAVMAIGNVKLFEEVQARTRELQESLEYQTATGEILNVISRSPTDLQPVMDVIAENAARVCGATNALIFRVDGDVLRLVAIYGPIPTVPAVREHGMPLGRGTVTGRAVLDRRSIHVADLAAELETEYPDAKPFQQAIGHRTALSTPLLREGVPLGAIHIRRLEVKPFSEKQIALLETFADQAVIAIENVRLFEEVQSRTAELDRSVGELRALGEVSQAVNSTLDLKTVLETIVAKAVQLSETDAGAIYVFNKATQKFRLRATYGMSVELIAAISSHAVGLKDAGIGEAARTRAPVQMPDLSEGVSSPVHQIVLDAGYRSLLAVPLLRPNKIVGALVVRRKTTGLFSESTVHLMETFAAQSVLAIQNARLFSEIEEKSHQLEIASRHKSQFLANMSHELRTPLNSVLGFTEMLVDGLYGELPERAKATLSRVQANGRHLLGLINDVLDLSKIEAGQLKLAVESYSVGQIVKSVVSATEPLARAKHLDLRTAVAENLPLGKGDERRLTQVLLNLVGNAIKFTDKGSIDIAAKMNDGFFEFIVRDTGPGIAPEQQSRIFEEFHQVDDSSTREKGGTGLGLAISKRIVEMHKGSIGVESTVGGGSTFRVVLPVSVEEEVEA